LLGGWDDRLGGASGEARGNWGFSPWGYPKMVGLEWKILLTWGVESLIKNGGENLLSVFGETNIHFPSFTSYFGVHKYQGFDPLPYGRERIGPWVNISQLEPPFCWNHFEPDNYG